MRCPRCGDDIVHGRCRFCGYQPSQEDLDAMARWESEKARVIRDSGPVTEDRNRRIRSREYDRDGDSRRDDREGLFYEPETERPKRRPVPKPARKSGAKPDARSPDSDRRSRPPSQARPRAQPDQDDPDRRQTLGEKTATRVMRLVIFFYLAGMVLAFAAAIGSMVTGGG